MIDQHLLLTLSLCEHDGTPLQSRLSEREVACWISNRALRPEYRARRGTCDLAVPVATQWHCAHTVVSEAQVPGATEAVEENTTTSVCLVLKVFITVHFLLGGLVRGGGWGDLTCGGAHPGRCESQRT